MHSARRARKQTENLRRRESRSLVIKTLVKVNEIRWKREKKTKSLSMGSLDREKFFPNPQDGLPSNVFEYEWNSHWIWRVPEYVVCAETRGLAWRRPVSSAATAAATDSASEARKLQLFTAQTLVHPTRDDHENNKHRLKHCFRVKHGLFQLNDIYDSPLNSSHG